MMPKKKKVDKRIVTKRSPFVWIGLLALLFWMLVQWTVFLVVVKEDENAKNLGKTTTTTTKTKNDVLSSNSQTNSTSGSLTRKSLPHFAGSLSVHKSLMIRDHADRSSEQLLRARAEGKDPVVSSRLVESSSKHKDFIELHHVCLKRERHNKITITYFGNDTSIQEKLSKGKNNRRRKTGDFQYLYWGGLAPADQALDFFLESSSTSSNVSFVQGKTLVATHHNPANLFHLHNDFFFPLWCAKEHYGEALQRLWILEGARYHWTNRILPLTDVILNILFPQEVVMPIEEKLPVCVEELVLSKLYIGFDKNHRPFYAHKGRFTERWHSQLTTNFRKAIWEGLSLSVNKAEKDKGMTTNNVRDQDKRSSEGNQPVLLWILRPGDTHRVIINEEELLNELKRYFRVLGFDAKEFLATGGEGIGRGIEPVKQQLEVLRNADIIMGIHGAGLTNALYMRGSTNKGHQDGSPPPLLIELVHAFAPMKRVFLNMASKLDIPYYAFDTTPYAVRSADPDPAMQPVQLPNSVIQAIANNLHEAYETELDNWKGQGSPPNVETASTSKSNECLFPISYQTAIDLISPEVFQQVPNTPQRPALEEGKLSPTNVSRCYLELYARNQWKTCSDYLCRHQLLDMLE